MSNREPMTVAEVAAELEGLVEKFGPDMTYDDFVAAEIDEEPLPEDCRYRARDGAPLCLVGQWMALHVDLAGVSNELNVEAFDKALDVGEGAFGELPPLTSVATRLLRAVQAHQDNGLTWGLALLRAEGVYLGEE